MKRIFALILVFALLATLCACGGKKAEGAEVPNLRARTRLKPKQGPTPARARILRAVALRLTKDSSM